MTHSYKSACDPKHGGPICGQRTFSVSFFRIVPKKSGIGSKHKPVGYRIIGSVEDRDKVFQRAEEIVSQLNQGWTPTKKSERYKP